MHSQHAVLCTPKKEKTAQKKARLAAHAIQAAPTASTATQALDSPTANASANPTNQKIASQEAETTQAPKLLPQARAAAADPDVRQK
jgi:hypothetical protein